MHVGIVSFTDVDSGIDLANALDEKGVKITYYLSKSHVEMAAGEKERPIERLYGLGILSSTVNTRIFQLKRMRDPGSFAVMQNLARAIREDHLDAVHILLGSGEIWTAFLAYLLHDIPVASTMIIPRPNISEFPPAPIALMVNQLLVKSSDILIVNGKDHISLVEKMYHIPRERIRYIPLGPRNIFLRWSRHSFPEDPGAVLFQGRVNKHKGLEYLIRAQPIVNSEFPKANFIIAGRGKDLNRCLNMIRDPDRFTIYNNYISGELVAELFQKSSIVVVPYVSAATSGVVMTALVFQKPVVATKVGNLPEYVKDGLTGLLVPPRNEKKLAEAIIRLLKDRDLRQQMGNNDVAYTQGEFNWMRLASETMCAYQNAIDFHKT